MSFMKGDLLTKTRKLVNGLAKPQPVWLKAMEHAPPATFPRPDGKLKTISLPEDVYIKKFFQKHPESKGQDAIKISAYDPPPARLFGLRVLELKEQGVIEEEAMTVADGTKPPPNPYPSAIKERQALERKFVRERFSDPEILKLVEKMKDEKRAERYNGTAGTGF
ncbi:hypothetical protein V6N13_061385 [Hibiscus sabdariffa]|uniref:Small ribosomal subunit protein mS23 n=1 Tax=Hibiscus sabdariffa TaxID=183260 RepID=A0ABR2EFG9_9ROSI